MTVAEGLDRADDWIVERAGEGDIVVTADVPLADRCVKRGARVIAPNGRPFTPDSIGADLATRNLMTSLREAGEIGAAAARSRGRTARASWGRSTRRSRPCAAAHADGSPLPLTGSWYRNRYRPTVAPPPRSLGDDGR